MTRHNSKLKKATGVKKGHNVMSALPTQAAARPGAWRAYLTAAPTDETANKHRHVPVVIDDAVIQDVADGGKSSEIEEKYSLREGYVRDVLIRRFGSIEGMKKALRAQCFENAIALGEYAMANIEKIPPGQALVGAKIMIDGGLALEKSNVDLQPTVDFAALHALGGVLERVEKRILGTDRTIVPV